MVIVVLFVHLMKELLVFSYYVSYSTFAVQSLTCVWYKAQ
jgi:hypothetical protein